MEYWQEAGDNRIKGTGIEIWARGRRWQDFGQGYGIMAGGRRRQDWGQVFGDAGMRKDMAEAGLRAGIWAYCQRRGRGSLQADGKGGRLGRGGGGGQVFGGKGQLDVSAL
jgi:hypothetical protein